MNRLLALAPALLLLGCPEPPKVNRCIGAIADLEDLYRWDPQRGGEGPGDPFQLLVAAEPTDSVPSLIQALTNTNPTKIDDGIHPPVVVAEVAFQALLAIFSMNAKEFERDGVLIRKSETNPIYALILDKPDIRIRLQNRFRRLATEREWLGQ